MNMEQLGYFVFMQEQENKNNEKVHNENKIVSDKRLPTTKEDFTEK